MPRGLLLVRLCDLPSCDECVWGMMREVGWLGGSCGEGMEEGESWHVMIEVGVFIRRCVGGHLGVYALDILLAMMVCCLASVFRLDTREDFLYGLVNWRVVVGVAVALLLEA